MSIGTLRKAVDELVHEHVLVRRQGKGTFVALHNDARFMFQFFHVEPREEFALAGELREREYPQVDCVAFARGRADDTEAGGAAHQAGRSGPAHRQPAVAWRAAPWCTTAWWLRRTPSRA